MQMVVEDELNALKDIHGHLSELSTEFRKKVCIDCNWSAPTFYRKMREPDKFSNAERDKIVVIMREVTRQAILYFKRYD